MSNTISNYYNWIRHVSQNASVELNELISCRVLYVFYPLYPSLVLCSRTRVYVTISIGLSWPLESICILSLSVRVRLLYRCPCWSFESHQYRRLDGLVLELRWTWATTRRSEIMQTCLPNKLTSPCFVYLFRELLVKIQIHWRGNCRVVN